MEAWELATTSVAGSVALTSVALTNVVVSATPFQATTVDGRNPEPAMSNTVSAAPATRLAGAILAIAGTELFTAKSTWDEEPPPGAELTTVSFPVPACARIPAESVALRLVGELYVVGIELPFHSTVDVGTNPEPVMVTAVSLDPVIAEGGATVVMLGTGFE
jgi:hypothetical protein